VITCPIDGRKQQVSGHRAVEVLDYKFGTLGSRRSSKELRYIIHRHIWDWHFVLRTLLPTERQIRTMGLGDSRSLENSHVVDKAVLGKDMVEVVETFYADVPQTPSNPTFADCYRKMRSKLDSSEARCCAIVMNMDLDTFTADASSLSTQGRNDQCSSLDFTHRRPETALLGVGVQLMAIFGERASICSYYAICLKSYVSVVRCFESEGADGQVLWYCRNSGYSEH
jgi:hypothetical protein